MKWRLVAVVIAVMPMLTGCWDRSEIENRATVLCIGLDTIEHNTELSESVTTPPNVGFQVHQKVQLTAQIAVPGRIPLGPGESGGAGGGGETKPVWVIQSTGQSVEDAMQALQQKVSLKLFLSHLRVIIVSDNFARTVGMENFDDFVRRNAQIRRTAYFLVCKGQASTLMKTAPPLERVPALYLNAMVQEAMNNGKVPEGMLGQYLIKSSLYGQEPLAVYVTPEGSNDVLVTGLVYFRHSKMVGSLSHIQIPSFMEIVGKSKGGYSMLISVPGSKDKVMLQNIRRKSKIQISIQAGKPVANIKVQADAFISEKQGSTTQLTDPMVLTKLQQHLNDKLEEGIKSLIVQAQHDDVDIFGFGEYVRAKQPSYWGSHVKTREGWLKVFPQLQVHVSVTSTIRRIQMKAT